MIPKNVKIVGHWYKVDLIENLSRDYNANGQSCGNAQWIKIDPSLPIGQQHCTFLHEIIEQINSKHEINLPHNHICTLAESLYQVLKDNQLTFE